MSFINKRNLYGNEYNACALCEYQQEVKLIKRLINIVEKAVEQQKVEKAWSCEDICHSFAKTIVDYSKMAYDNVVLGNFHAVKMINRSILENLVCLEIIINNEELWKYYMVSSYWNTIYRFDHVPTQNELDLLQEIYEEYDISEKFYEKQPNRKKPYIKEQYGWTYKINDNKQFTFENMCNMIGKGTEYRGFKMLSDYSHGTSYYLKFHSSIFHDEMMGMFADMYINLYRMVTLYCFENVDERFDDVTDKLENIFYRFIQYEEDHFGNS